MSSNELLNWVMIGEGLVPMVVLVVLMDDGFCVGFKPSSTAWVAVYALFRVVLGTESAADFTTSVTMYDFGATAAAVFAAFCWSTRDFILDSSLWSDCNNWFPRSNVLQAILKIIGKSHLSFFLLTFLVIKTWLEEARKKIVKKVRFLSRAWFLLFSLCIDYHFLSPLIASSLKKKQKTPYKVYNPSALCFGIHCSFLMNCILHQKLLCQKLCSMFLLKKCNYGPKTDNFWYFYSLLYNKPWI